MTATPQQILTLARNKVKRGWLQHTMSHGGKVCALGGITYAARHYHLSDINGCGCVTCLGYDPRHPVGQAMVFLLAAVGERTGQQWPCIPDWNDEEGRTQGDVLDTFDHAIKLAERDQVLGVEE